MGQYIMDKVVKNPIVWALVIVLGYSFYCHNIAEREYTNVCERFGSFDKELQGIFTENMRIFTTADYKFLKETCAKRLGEPVKKTETEAETETETEE